MVRSLGCRSDVWGGHLAAAVGRGSCCDFHDDHLDILLCVGLVAPYVTIALGFHIESFAAEIVHGSSSRWEDAVVEVLWEQGYRGSCVYQLQVEYR